MQPYREFRPTSFDCKGLNAHSIGPDDDPDCSDWLVVPVGQTRDSGDLDQSNFSAALKMLGGEGDNVIVCRFNHWGPGWFEIILVRPGTAEAAKAEEIESSLADYPVLDEEDWSNREWDTACRTWEMMSLRERVELLGSCRETWLHCKYSDTPSIFAARRDELPQDPDGRLFEYLTRG